MQGFKDVPRAVWLLLPGVFVNAVSSFTFVFVFVYLTGPRGLSVSEAGLITGIGGIGLVAGNFTGGGFGDRFGHRRVLLVASALAGGALVLLPALPTAVLYAALPPAQYAIGSIRSANAALVAVIVPEGVRRQAFAVVRCVSNGGFTLGAPLGALIATGLSYDWLFVCDGAGILVFALWTARVVPARGAANTPTAAPDGGRGRGVWGELRTRPAVLVMLVAVLVVDVIYRQQYTTFPVYLAAHGFSTAAYGLIIALNGAVILVLELPAAVALRTRPPLRVIGVGLLLVGAGYGALLLGPGIAAAVAMMLLLSLGEILYKTTATAYVADQAPAHAIGLFQSLYAGVSASGVVLGGPLGGALYSAAPGLLWPLCAALAAGAGGAVLWMSVRVAREPRPAGEALAAREPEPGLVPGPAEAPARHDPRPAHETGSRPRAVAG
ncbi:MFS transporter [Streptomyces sp. NBC_01298]|nr:MFS transporter [Streptomyces sp. NBC_01298]